MLLLPLLPPAPAPALRPPPRKRGWSGMKDGGGAPAACTPEIEGEAGTRGREEEVEEEDMMCMLDEEEDVPLLTTTSSDSPQRGEPPMMLLPPLLLLLPPMD